MDRSRGASVLAAVLLVGAAGWAPPDVAAAQCGSTQVSGGTWSAVDMPPTPSLPREGASAIVASSAVGQDPSVVLATDGVSVFRSTDAGCSWHTTYTLGPMDYWSDGGVVTGYTITNIANGHSAAPVNRQDVYLALTPNQLLPFTLVPLFTFAVPELVAVSHDGGQTYSIVQPAPTAAHPFVPECLEAPTTFVVPATDTRAVYLLCGAAVAQGIVEGKLAGDDTYAYRSSDGGVSWSLLGIPTIPEYAGQWFVVGPKVKELWVAGEWTLPNTAIHYLAVWHSTDDGAHWTLFKPAGKPGIGIGPVGLAIDPTGRSGGERVVVYAPIGAYTTTDDGKHWSKLTGSGSTFIAVAFFSRHSLYAVGTTSAYGCQAGTVVLRYTNFGGKPRSTPFPGQWGYYVTWGVAGSFATVSGGAQAFGAARFCPPPNGAPPPPKLLTYRVG